MIPRVEEYLPEYLSSNEIQEMHGWSYSLIYKLASEDKWRKSTIGRRTYYHAWDVAETRERRAKLDSDGGP